MKNTNNNKHAEILCIGSELLLGNIVNSNSRWLAEELALIGVPHYRQSVVGDNFARIKELVLEASKRSRLLITTGGLGPTPDDITHETLAAVFNSSLETRNEVYVDIEKKVKTNIDISSNNLFKQTLLPPNSKIIPNPTGTAPGIIWTPKPGFTVMTFPGVPSELKNMWAKTAVPWIKNNLAINEIFHSKIMKFVGISESNLAQQIDDLLQKENPTVAPYASLGEVKLRITAKAKTIEIAQNLINPIEKELRFRTGLKCFGTDNESLPSVVLDLLRQRGQTLAVAESCTGGSVGAALTSVPGSSDVFRGGVIAYSNEIKHSMLNVSNKLLSEYGAVSSEVAKAMAEGAKTRLNADWAVAITGLSGPGGGSQAKPIGLVEFAVASPRGCYLNSEKFSSHLDRDGIRKLCVMNALNQLRLLLLSQS